MLESDEYPPHVKSALDEVVSKQVIIGYFSVNRDGNYLSDSSQLKYFHERPANFDLDRANSAAAQEFKDSRDHRVDHLLQWIKLNHEVVQASGQDSWIEPEFVCANGLLGKVMYSLSYEKEPYIVLAARWKGTIYLRLNDTSEITSPEHEKFAKWGMNFKDYLRSDAPDKRSDVLKPFEVEAQARFVYVSRCRIGDHSVLISDKLEALDSSRTIVDPLELNDYGFVKLKTRKNPVTAKDHYNFKRYKLPLSWSYCFFTNNPRLVCGFFNKVGIVERLETFSLPKIVRECKGYLDPVRCVKGCRDFLDMVAENVVDDCNKTIYKFEKRADVGILPIEELSPEIFGILPSTYFAASE